MSDLSKMHRERQNGTVQDVMIEECYLAYRETLDIRFYNEYLWMTVPDVYRGSLFNYQFIGCSKFPEHTNMKLESRIIKRDFLRPNLFIAESLFHLIQCYLMLDKNLGKIRFIYITNQLSLLDKVMLIVLKGVEVYKWEEFMEGSEKFAIGFHKLRKILPQAFIDKFSMGVINDHWGELPYFRGRSTRKWHELFDRELVITTHLVTKGIDRGDIIGKYRYPILREVAIHLLLWKRVADSIRILSEGIVTHNDKNLGKDFYEMHPLIWKNRGLILKLNRIDLDTP